MSKSRHSILISVFTLLVFIPVVAQNGEVAGRNVNMVSGTGWPGGDPFLQRQNEPSMAVSTRNPAKILAGANDYRTVDLPFVDTTGEEENGDAWLGVFKSFDGGARWQSVLLPGYPQDRSPEGLNSPLHGFGAAADPTVRAGTNGLFYYSGIVFNRGPQGQVPSAVFLSRFIDNNNKENGDVTKQDPATKIATPSDPIRYLSTLIVGRSKNNQFVDKPALAVDIPRDRSTCTITTIQDGKRITQTVPAGPVYMAYTVFLDNDPNIRRSRIMFVRSNNCGQSFSHPFDISKPLDAKDGDDDDDDWDHNGQNNLQLVQSPAIAIDPNWGIIYVAFRRFNANGNGDAIMLTRSFDGGRHFTRAITVPSFSSLYPPFDEPTIGVGGLAAFRFNSYPTITVDDSSRVYIGWSARGFAADARIVLTTSSPFATTWSAPAPVDSPAMTPLDDPFGRGHQLMPSLTFSAGKLMLLYYDLRQDSTGDTLDCSAQPTTCNAFTALEQRIAKGYLLIPQPDSVFESFIVDSYVDNGKLNNGGQLIPVPKSKWLHTIDVRAAQADPANNPVFNSVRVSQYNMGSRSGSSLIEQLQFNASNLPMFVHGTAPFMGDYIDIAPAPAFVLVNGKWKYNTDAINGQVYHAAWTDNRDVRPPANGDWSQYTPPRVPGLNTGDGTSSSIFDPNQNIGMCNAANTGSRNQNIYTSLITPGVFVSTPTNSKPLGQIKLVNGQIVPCNGSQCIALQRAFVVIMQNATKDQKTFRLTIANQPAGGKASFLQFATSTYPPPINALPDPLTFVDVNVAPGSSASRSVFVTSSVRNASVKVNVTEFTAPQGSPVPGGFQTAVTLNPDPTNPDVANPDVANPDVANPDVANAEVYNPDVANPDVANPDVANPDVANPDVANPDVANPDVANPDVANPDVANPDVANPDVANPDVANPDVANPDVANPDVANPDVANQDLGDSSNPNLTDANWNVTNNGNTTASYAVKLFGTDPSTATDKFQLILRKVYFTPTSQNCSLKVTPHNVVIANISRPSILPPGNLPADDNINPDVKNTTITLGPGETAKITLRGTVPLPVMKQIVLTQVTPVVVPQAVNTITVVTNGGGQPQPTISLSILTPAVPDVNTGSPYSAQLTAIGGRTPYHWTLSDASSLPDGLVLDPNTGLISGTPTTTNPTGTPFAVEVVDSSSPANVYTKLYTIHVVSPVAIVTEGGLPQAAVGTPFSFTFVSSGGVPPITWSAIAGEGSALPPGLTLDPATGTLSGVPTAQGIYSFTIRATDAFVPVHQFAQRGFRLLVQPPPSLGDLIVADGGPSAAGSLVRVSADGAIGTVLATFTGRAAGVGIDPNGDFYTALPTLNKIAKVTRLGGVVSDFAAGAPMQQPINVIVDSVGNVFVADNAVDKIFKFSPKGVLIGTFNLPRPSPTLLQDIAMTFDSSGNLIVADDEVGDVSGSTEILRLNGTDFTTLFQSNLDLGLGSTTGIVQEPTGTFLVSDFRLNRITRLSGSSLTTFLQMTSSPTAGLAQDSFNGMLYTGSNFANLLLDITNGNVRTILNGLPLTFPNTVAVFRQRSFSVAQAADFTFQLVPKPQGFFQTNARSVNDSAQAIGAMLPSACPQQDQAFFFDGTTTTLIPTLGTVGGCSPNSTPANIAASFNNSGNVVGRDMTAGNAGFYYNGSVTVNLNNLVTDANFTGNLNQPAAINDAGDVVGRYTLADGSQHSFLLSQGHVTDLGDFFAAGTLQPQNINRSQQIVGVLSNPNGVGDAALWQNGRLTDLNIGIATRSVLINNAGQITGAENGSGGFINTFVWENGNSINLGALPGDDFSAPIAINDFGQIIGESRNSTTGAEHFFIWDKTNGMRDLNGVLANSGIALNEPCCLGFNNNGQIFSFASLSGKPVSGLHITPFHVPTPAGANILVQSGGVDLLFSSIAKPGVTSVAKVDPATITTIPQGTTIYGTLAYQVTSTASSAGQMRITISVPGPVPVGFANLHVYQNDPVLGPVEITVGPPDFIGRKLTAITSSNAPIYVVQPILIP